MAKFKTRGGKKAVEVGTLSIDAPLLGSGMALGGRSMRKQKANERRKRVRQEKRYERALDELVSGRGTNPKTARKMLQKETIRRHKAYTGDEPW